MVLGRPAASPPAAVKSHDIYVHAVAHGDLLYVIAVHGLAKAVRVGKEERLMGNAASMLDCCCFGGCTQHAWS